jgi:phenylacetate-CoA ligase
VRELWKSLYGYLPVSLQNAAISLYGLHYRRERFGAAYAPTVAAFEERERWSVARMQQHLTGRLRAILQLASQAPHYRAAWNEIRPSPPAIESIEIADLPLFPSVTKEMLRRDPYGFIPSVKLGSSNLLKYHSSGSTGTPITAICTPRDQQRFAAAREARSYRWAGTSIRRPRAMIGGQPIVRRADAHPPFYRYNAAEKQVYFSAYHLAPANIRDYVDGFNRYRPELVTGYAFSQFLLARMMLEQGLRFDSPPRVSITSSEKLTAAMKDVIRRAWGCRAFEEYGSVENVGLITECEHGCLHANPDFGIIEIVDGEGNPVPPGTEGRVLCTGLLNETQVLVRYEIGDIATWSDCACACGRDALPTVAALTGRIEDVVVGPDGRELVRFHGIFVGLPFVHQGQVVQLARTRFLVRVITEDGFGPAQVNEIEKRFAKRLGTVNVQVERVTELERTPTGKVRAVISRLES